MNKVLAWHFLRDDKKLNYPPHTVVEIGKTLSIDGGISLCIRGFHASTGPFDALQYAPGNVVCRVEVSGQIIYGEDKLVATERKVLAMADCTDVLWEMCKWNEEQIKNDKTLSEEDRAWAWAWAWARARAWAWARARARARAWAWAEAWARARAWAWAFVREKNNEELERKLKLLLDCK